ncbi:MAG: hypothetical protein AMXMBFR7_21790 [Planctomycetota bacterium]
MSGQASARAVVCIRRSVGMAGRIAGGAGVSKESGRREMVNGNGVDVREVEVDVTAYHSPFTNLRCLARRAVGAG